MEGGGGGEERHSVDEPQGLRLPCQPSIKH